MPLKEEMDEMAAMTSAALEDDTPTTSTELKKPKWISSQAQGEENTVIIEELPSKKQQPPSRPVKKVVNNNNNKQKQQQQQGMDNEEQLIDSKSSSDDNNYNTAAEAARGRNNHQTNNNLGTRPKQTNLSLLSSTVAHATLERCLLGCNGGSTQQHNSSQTTQQSDDSPSSFNTNNNPNINYSKQCKPGHVIDILELRRLSSRGVPDEPPPETLRNRAVSAPAVEFPSTPTMESKPKVITSTLSSPSIQHSSPTTPPTTTGNLHNNRSYRPLVWRVLLGYLPPETDRWNDVLSRDRKLYDTLVNELFSTTCPRPHDVYTQEELEEIQQKRKNNELQLGNNGNEIRKSKKSTSDEGDNGGGSEFVIDDDDNEEEDVLPTTPIESTEEASTTKSTRSTTPTTPGLLSARMQQEWVRNNNGCVSPGGGGEGNDNNDISARLSPMCAMNTPRTRIRKEVFTRNNDNEEKDTTASLTSGMESLLLPEDGDDEGVDEGEGDSIELMDTISVESGKDEDGRGEERGDGSEKNTTTDVEDTLPSSLKLSRSISITKTSSEEEYTEGVELCRQSSHDADNDDNNDDDAGAIHPHPASAIPDTDEEENILLLDEIRKDVIRTHPDLRFFLEPKEDLGQKRYAALERILFVWAKLNKGVRYVQGMNEIVGTLYFVLANDFNGNEDWSNEAEADTYFLFNALMVEMRDVFVPDLDDADTGIHGRISNMITLLSLHDPEVRCHLDNVGIDPSFYSVRWLTTLLSREFLLPDTIRLWDSMFASTHKDNFLRYVSVTMVMVIRDQLLCGDFSACLRLLQAYPPTNLDRLLESSRALWIYESQITLACHKGGISLGHALRSITPPPAIIMAYGLHGGVAPPIREQVREAGKRGMAVARGAANGASTTVASAGRSFLGNAVNFWRAGSSANSSGHGEVRRSKSTM